MLIKGRKLDEGERRRREKRKKQKRETRKSAMVTAGTEGTLAGELLGEADLGRKGERSRDGDAKTIGERKRGRLSRLTSSSRDTRRDDSDPSSTELE